LLAKPDERTGLDLITASARFAERVKPRLRRVRSRV
jgi:hypothetical protein